MKSLLRRGTLTAVVALVVLPAAANAAFTPAFPAPIATKAAGCQPKAPLAFQLQAGGVPVGTKYTIVAVTGTTTSTPCGQNTALAASSAANLVSWNATPGADSYKVYRGNNLITGPIPANATTCPPDSGNTPIGRRCSIIDSGGNPSTAETAPADRPDFTQAGGSPDLGISQTFDYGGASATSAADDPAPDGTANSASLKDNILHFPAGLAANPAAATATCSLTQLIGDKATATGGAGTSDANEDKCPRGSQVGTVTALIQSAPVSAANPPTPAVGDIYLGQKLGNETARLFVALRPPCSRDYPAPLNPGGSACTTRLGAATRETEKSFLSAIATIRKDGTFGIDNETTSVSEGEDKDLSANTNVRSSTTGALLQGVPIQVRSLTQDLWGQADQGTAAASDDKPFVVLPTRCDAKTFGADAASYLDPALKPATTALAAPTGCANVPFDPKLTFAVDATGQSGQNGHPKVVATITQATGEAATKKTVVTLPEGLGTNTLILGNACKQVNVANDTCPAASKIGTATATTPLLPGTFAGNVYLAEPTVAGNLPNLEVFLKGPADIHFTGTTAFDSTNTRLVNVFDNLPEVPLNSFVLTVDGGANGLLNNSRNLCSGLGTANVVSNGYNGKTTTADVATALTGQGTCTYPIPPSYPAKPAKPKVKIKVKGVKKNRPTLSMSIKRGNSAKVSNLRKSTVTLPSGLRFTGKGKKRTVVKVNGKKVKTFTAKGRKLTITSKSTTKTITVSTKRGALKESSKVRRGGKKKKLTFKTTVRVQKPKTYKITTKVKPKS